MGPRSRDRRRGASPPFGLLLGLLIGLLLYASTQLAIRDVDVYWHLRAGSELLSGVPVGDVGAEWSFAPDPRPWVTTQWLAEVLLDRMHAMASWPGLIAFRAISAALATALLGITTLRGRPTALAAFPFLIAASAVIAVSQERPNQVTIIGAAALGGTLLNGVVAARLPRWWVLLPLTWLWANLHGGWILVPAILSLVALARVLDHGLRDGAARSALLLGIAAGIVGTLTPAGMSSTFATIRFSAAADAIVEWGRTAPLEGEGLLTLAMLVAITVPWAKSGAPRSELLVTLALLVFSWTALRNVAPALAMLAPMVAHRLHQAFPNVAREPEPRWSAPAGVGIAVALLVAGLSTLPGRQHLPVAEFPVGLARQIAQLPGDQRVLNDYNVAGLVLFFADPADRVGIDGRTDRYGSAYIEDYLDMKNLRDGWESLLASLDPTVALLESDSALAHVLVEERGWSTLGEEGNWVLLSAPGGT